MKRAYVQITRVGIHEEVLAFSDDISDEQIFNELNDFDVEDEIEMENEIEYSIKEEADK